MKNLIWNIAWKNLWRNKTRSAIVMCAVAIGIFGGAYAGAIMYGIAGQKITTAIENEVSHIQLHNPKFLENREMNYTIPDAEGKAEMIRRIPGVKSVSVRTEINGMVFSPNSSTGVKIIGVDPQNEKQVTKIYERICDSCGNYFEEAKKNPVVISKKMAEKLKVKLNSKIIVRFQAINGEIVESAFKVCGIYRTNNSGFDQFVIFTRQSDLAAILEQEGIYHEIAVLLDDHAEIKKIREQIKTAFPGLSVLTWDELEPDLWILTSTMNKMMYVIVAIILLALAFGIVNTMLMVVFERTRELGMLMAIGMNKAKLFRMILLETILLSLTGGVAGLFFTWILVLITARTGLDFSSVREGFESFGYDSVIYPVVNTGYFLVIIILVVLTGIFSSIYPARKALSLRPADAVRFE